MLSDNQDLYTYNSDIQELQQPSQQSQDPRLENQNINFPPNYQQSSLSFNKSLSEFQNEMNNLNMVNQQNITYSMNDKIIEFLKYYFFTFIIPLIVFVFVFVVFSLDFVKDFIFNILKLQDTDDQTISLTICILYGLIIGIVYMIGIKIIERFIQF